MATFFLDYEGGNDASDGTTFANRWKTMTSGATAARIAPGDTIKIMGSPAPTSLGINGTFTNKSATVTLASALNILIADCESTFTASANVTSTADTALFRAGTKSSKNVVAGAFTTGLAAYFATGTLNLSSYQGITFWIRVDTVVAAASLSIHLCSDAVGAVTVDTLVVPAVATATISGWYPVYIDKGSALGASIASVALYVDTDLGAGAVTVYLDNISSVKAAGNDALNLQSFIGTNAADDTWWAIRNINGTTITLDESPAMTQANTARGYSTPLGTATPQTVTAYKRETIKMATGSNQHAPQDSGTVGNLITYSGGWNRTDMTTQTLDTWWDGCTGGFTVILGNAKLYNAFTKMSCVRGSVGLSMVGAGCDGINVLDGHFNNNSSHGVTIVCTLGNPTIGTIFCCSNGGNGYGEFITSFLINCTITSLTALSNRTNGIVIQCWKFGRATTLVANNNASAGVTEGGSVSVVNSKLRIDTVTTNDNGTFGFIFDAQATMIDIDIRVMNAANNSSPGLFLGGCLGKSTIGLLTTSGNGTAGVEISGANLGGDIIIHNSSIAEALKIFEISTGGTSGQTGSVRFQNYLGVVGDCRSDIVGSSGIVTTESGAGRHTGSGRAWTLLQNSIVAVTSQTPLKFKLASLAVSAGTLVTVTAYMNRTNIALITNLVCPGRQIAGVNSDVASPMTVAASTWEQLTISFTPSDAGVVDIECWVYGGLHSVTVDDMTFTQA